MYWALGGLALVVFLGVMLIAAWRRAVTDVVD